MSIQTGFTPLVTIVGFHHARGPEVEGWFGVDDGQDPAADNDWPLLPFMALSDGAHASTEDFSYFTLRQTATATRAATSLFGMSCTRQVDASTLKERPADVTRSTVQKAVVIIVDSPHAFGPIRERLSMVTRAWFAQRNFTDLDIIKVPNASAGLPLRELIHEFKHQTLVLFKCCLLQPKMLFFGSRCEKLCMMQFSLISLIPSLLRNLQDCADPELDNYRQSLVKPTSLKTSERNSLIPYMGLPLQIFSKGGFFGPYTPLQQLDVLADYGTKSYVVGSTNPLLLQQRDRYSDILINLDESSISITSPSLRTALALTVADRRWIDFLTQSVQETWDDSDPSRPKTMGYTGSEEFIRLQFEDYLLSLISSVKYHIYLQGQTDPKALLADVEGDPSQDFGSEWRHAWMQTENFKIFQASTDSHLFDIVEPHHPCAGGLTMEDIQRRVAQQVSELHLDERFSVGKEVLGKHLAEGQKKVTSAFNTVWADIEVLRETQRKRYEERQRQNQAAGINNTSTTSPSEHPKGEPIIISHASIVWPKTQHPAHTDFAATATASVQAASTRAAGYISSWTTWAGEKRRERWGSSSSNASGSPAGTPSPSPSHSKSASGASTTGSPVKPSSESRLKRMSGHGHRSSVGGFSVAASAGGRESGGKGLLPLQLGRKSLEGTEREKGEKGEKSEKGAGSVTQ
ncbi:MAG: late secretory pathway protein avl9 [Caeruleum heppii]|nr:MAG: late secretory pathway protein avl9 [Caeruleum heppii]